MEPPANTDQQTRDCVYSGPTALCCQKERSLVVFAACPDHCSSCTYGNSGPECTTCLSGFAKTADKKCQGNTNYNLHVLCL